MKLFDALVHPVTMCAAEFWGARDVLRGELPGDSVHRSCLRGVLGARSHSQRDGIGGGGSLPATSSGDPDAQHLAGSGRPRVAGPSMPTSWHQPSLMPKRESPLCNLLTCRQCLTASLARCSRICGRGIVLSLRNTAWHLIWKQLAVGGSANGWFSCARAAIGCRWSAAAARARCRLVTALVGDAPGPQRTSHRGR